MGTSVMNSDYESEELHSLVESSSDHELGYYSDYSDYSDKSDDDDHDGGEFYSFYDSDDNFEDDKSTHVGDGRGQKNKEVRKFPVFKPVAKAEHISSKKDIVYYT